MPGKRRHVSTGSSFEHTGGYARAVVDGDWVFVAGTTGYDDYVTLEMPVTVEAQAHNCLRTIEDTMEKAGGALADVVRLVIYLRDGSDVEKVFPILGARFGEIRPAMTMVVAGLIRPEMKIEIEATARLS